MKRIVSLLLAVLLCTGLCAESASAVQVAPDADWFNLVSFLGNDLYMGRANYDEAADTYYTTLLELKYITTRMIQLCVENPGMCDLEGNVEYTATELRDFVATAKVTDPEGNITEESRTESVRSSGVDDVNHLHDLTLMTVFGSMLENNGHITPGLYLYEIFMDDELVLSEEFNVVDSDTAFGETDHETKLYTTPDCSEAIAIIPEYDKIELLEVDKTSEDYKGYVYKVLWGDQEGYLKCYDVYPLVDERVQHQQLPEALDGMEIQSAKMGVKEGWRMSYEDMRYLTRGQLEYCMENHDFSIGAEVNYQISKPFLPGGLGTVVAEVVPPDHKKAKIELQIDQDCTPEESFFMICEQLNRKKKEGEYTVVFYVDGEEYASYNMSNWGDHPYMQEGQSKAWAVHFYTKITLPDETVYQSNSTVSMMDYYSQDGVSHHTYEAPVVLEAFEEMYDKQDYLYGLYTFAIYMNNVEIHSGRFELLEEDIVAALTNNSDAVLYEDQKLKTKQTKIGYGAFVQYKKEDVANVEIPSEYGDWTETVISIPVVCLGRDGYLSGNDVRMLTDSTLPTWLESVLHPKERIDWLLLNIGGVTTENSGLYGSNTGVTITAAEAALAAEQEAYKFDTTISFSLKDDRDAIFEISITKPDGSVFTTEKTVLPNYGLVGTCEFDDTSVNEMFKELKNGGGILPGTYHFEILEKESGLLREGWFDVLDVQLGLGFTNDDAKLYASLNRQPIAEVPIHSTIFLYDGYLKDYSMYYARVSWDGKTGYMLQTDYHVDHSSSETLLKLLSDQPLQISGIDVYTYDLNYTGEEDLLSRALETYEIEPMLEEWGTGSIYVKAHYTAPAAQQLHQLSLVLESPSGKQLVTSDMFVLTEECSGEIVDASTIMELFKRMQEQQKIETGTYSYRMMINDEIIAQTQFEVSR